MGDGLTKTPTHPEVRRRHCCGGSSRLARRARAQQDAAAGSANRHRRSLTIALMYAEHVPLPLPLDALAAFYLQSTNAGPAGPVTALSAYGASYQNAVSARRLPRIDAILTETQRSKEIHNIVI